MRKLTIEEIIDELQSNDAELQFLGDDEETGALIYSITRVNEDGSFEEELILYDGDMDELMFAIADEFFDENNIEEILFAEYDGVLRLIINGKMITFGEDGDYPKFWELVDVKPDKNEVGNEWRVIEENLPDFLKPHVGELAQIINSRF
ncbi:MAG: hypothetical protein HDR18_16740 [Lachnospiraceae bacterium]|nr:hypothetical protein [Lachnospiraceae bacterium]